jgi:hypothetical protein
MDGKKEKGLLFVVWLLVGAREMLLVCLSLFFTPFDFGSSCYFLSFFPVLPTRAQHLFAFFGLLIPYRFLQPCSVILMHSLPRYLTHGNDRWEVTRILANKTRMKINHCPDCLFVGTPLSRIPHLYPSIHPQNTAANSLGHLQLALFLRFPVLGLRCLAAGPHV